MIPINYIKTQEELDEWVTIKISRIQKKFMMIFEDYYQERKEITDKALDKLKELSGK